MSGYAKCNIIGRLTRDPEVRYTQSNTAVCNFSVAVNRSYKTSGGEKKDEVSYFDCVAWGATGENIAKFYTKGRIIAIECEPRQETWQDKTDGSNRSKIVFNVNQFVFCDSKPEGDAPAQHRGGGQAKNPLSQGQKQNIRQTVGAGQPPVDDIDLPF